MKSIAGIIIGLLTVMWIGVSYSQPSNISPGFYLLSTIHAATNQNLAYRPIGVSSEVHTDAVIPLLQMRAVPLGTAIATLASEAGINCLIHQRLVQSWIDAREPAVTLKMENVKPKDALQRILDAHHLALVENRATGIGRVISDNQSENSDNMVLLAELMTNAPAAGTNGIFPVIQFSDVPLDSAIKHLTCATGFQFSYPERLEKTDGTPWFSNMPNLTIRFENVSALQVLFELCENYDLTITRDDATGVLGIEPKRFKVHHHLQLR